MENINEKKLKKLRKMQRTPNIPEKKKTKKKKKGKKFPKWFTEKEKLSKKESFVAQNFPKEMWKKIGDPKKKSMDELQKMYINKEEKKLDKIKEQQRKKKE